MKDAPPARPPLQAQTQPQAASHGLFAARAKNLWRAWRGGPVPVASTPQEVVGGDNKWRLLHYVSAHARARYVRPVLLVPSLINRHYVLDLAPGRSFAEWLVAQGHEVYCIDWGTPAAEDRFVDFGDIVEDAIGRALRLTARHAATQAGEEHPIAPHLFGYCMGGSLAAIHVALHPRRVASLVALAAPVSFVDDGLLATWTRTHRFEVEALVAGLGTIPWPLLQSSFHLLRPTHLLQKAVTVVDRAWNDRFLDGFLATETWSNDNVDLPGEFYRTWIEDLYRRDALTRGELVVRGRVVDLAAIEVPTLAVYFTQDHIAPRDACAELISRISSPDKAALELAGSHVGGMTSSNAKTQLWPRLSEFWIKRDGARS